MSGPLSRRRFVAGAAAGFGFLHSLPAAAPLLCRVVLLGPEVEPLVAAHRGYAARSAAREGRRADPRRHELPTAARRRLPRRRARHPAAAGRLQVSRRPGRQLRPPRQPGRRRQRPLAAAVLGARQLQGRPGGRTSADNDWRMAPVDEGKLPSPTQAKQRFVEAMDTWDVEAADRAVAALARTAGAGEIVELFWRYGARDFRDIGHKAIYVANGWPHPADDRLAARRADPALARLRSARTRGRQPGQPRRQARPPWPRQPATRG